MYRKTKCLLQAHRGVSYDAPENTLSAFRLAKEQGYDLVEFDVRFTKDNVPILYHDSVVNRTARKAGETFGEEKVAVSSLTFAEYAELDVGAWKDPKYTGEGVLTFARALDYLVYAGLEGKADNVLQTYTPEQLEIFLSVLRRHGNEKIGITCSKNLDLLERFANEFPHHSLHFDGEITPENLARIASFAKGHVTTIWAHLDDPKIAAWCKIPPVTPETAKAVKDAGFRLGIWILQEEEEMERALALGADAVETNGKLKP